MMQLWRTKAWQNDLVEFIPDWSQIIKIDGFEIGLTLIRHRRISSSARSVKKRTNKSLWQVALKRELSLINVSKVIWGKVPNGIGKCDYFIVAKSRESKDLGLIYRSVGIILDLFARPSSRSPQRFKT